jgi:hypothetical protein
MNKNTEVDLKFLDKKASGVEEMPNGLNPIEQAYYLSARSIYREFKEGKISIEQARTEKEDVLKQYVEGMKAWELFVALHSVKEKLRELQVVGFNTVLEYEIMDEIEEILSIK